MLGDGVISVIRTVVPVLVGAVLTWLASRLGIVLGEQSSAELVSGLVAVATTAGYYALARWAESRWPAAGWLLGVPAAPTYERDLPGV